MTSREDEILDTAQAHRGEWVLFDEIEIAPKGHPDRFLQFESLGTATRRARALAGRRKIRLETDAQVEELRVLLFVRCVDESSDGVTLTSDATKEPDAADDRER